MKNLKYIIFLGLILSLMTQSGYGLPKEKYMKKKENEVQRDPLGFFDFQKNTLSNIETVISNYGMIGYDRPNRVGSGYFPRNSRNQYIFGGGIWYAAQKKIPTIDTITGEPSFYLNKMVSVSYNPGTADSWQTPGRIEDGALTQGSPEKYKVFFSTDYSRTNGIALDPSDKETPPWPVWDTIEEDTVGYSRYFGYYLHEEKDRSLANYKKGPAMISGEDIFTTYHDLDLNQYEGALAERRQQGYPLGLQYEFTIYSWGFGQYQNFFFCSYDVINMSQDTLYDCWLAPIMDVDLARRPFLVAGASNDRVSYWYEDTELNLAYQFTNPEFGEQGQGFGYLGFDFLESPTIIRPPLFDDNGDSIPEYIKRDLGNGVIVYDTTYVADENHPDYKFLRKDSAFYDNSSQLGLVTFKNWNIDQDKDKDADRYNFISDGKTDVDFGPGDKRFMMATGAFHMRPGDTSRTVVCIMIATPSKTGDADGTLADRQGLKSLDIFAQAVYDNNFRAPRPPDAANILFNDEYNSYYVALNNAVSFSWDSTSEMSADREEAGLDFLGYRIDRGRVADLDTFNISQISPNTDYPRGAGPYGWKEVARYELPLPFTQSQRSIDSPTLGKAPIDSFLIVGPVFDRNGTISDTSAIRVIRAGQGVVFHTAAATFANTGEFVPAIAGINNTAPWGTYYNDLAKGEFSKSDYDNFNARYKFDRSKKLFDSALVGQINLDPARIPYNPLFVDHFTFEITKEYLKHLDTTYADGIAVIYKKENVVLGKDTVEIETSIVDSVYFVNTSRTYKDGNSNKLIIDGALPISNYANAMKDSSRVKRALDSLYSYIQQGKITYEFPDFESDSTVKQNVILPYMKEITNNRTFTDIGDDNRDGIIGSSDDFDNTEKLINNTPYYYRVLAYDKGDASQPTPAKLNSSVPKINQVETFPEANSVGKKLKFEIIDLDSNKMNGLYDFEFYAIDEDRAKKLFLGDTLELEFNPFWSYQVFNLRSINDEDKSIGTSVYLRNTTLKNLSKDSTLLFSQFIQFNPNGCYTADNIATSLFEDAAVIVGNNNAIVNEKGDTVNSFGVWNNNQIIDFSGSYTTGDFTEQNQCNLPYFLAPAYGTLGFDFKFALLQHGGNYRADTISIKEGDSKTTVYANDKDNQNDPKTGTLRSQAIDTIQGPLAIAAVDNKSIARRRVLPQYGSFNNGPVDVTLEFIGSGTEKITVEWGNDDNGNPSQNTKQGTFTVPYLDVKVTNNYQFTTQSANNSVTIKNQSEFEHISIDPILTGDIVTDGFTSSGANEIVIRKPYPDPRNLPAMGIEIDEFIGKYNVAAYGHVNSGSVPALRRGNSIARPLNSPLTNIAETYSGLPQGRYYMSSINSNGDTLDFLNVVNVAGAQFVLDKRAIGRIWTVPIIPLSINSAGFPRPNNNTEDFEVGDKVEMKTNGGASGLPFPNAKLKVVIKEENATAGLTDDEMEGIKIVPNPYYITHQNEQTPYESKLYFTQVPPGSTINIYTVSGNLIKTINHDPLTEVDGEGRVSVNVWDMIMKNGLRVQSQTLVAQIIAPNGAETLEKFSIVVGTFNVYDK